MCVIVTVNCVFFCACCLLMVLGFLWALGFHGFMVLGFCGFRVLGFPGFGVLGFSGFGVLGFSVFRVLRFEGLGF